MRSGQYNADPREKGVGCFVHHFRDWLTVLGRSYPLPADDFLPALADFTAMPTNSTCFDDTIVRPESSLRAECSAFLLDHLVTSQCFRWRRRRVSFDHLEQPDSLEYGRRRRRESLWRRA